MDRATRGGTWEPLEGMQLQGKTLGLIGLGGIGLEVARIARGIGMEVIAWNRTPRADAGVRLADLDTVLAAADVVSLHLSLNDETRGLIDAARIARMKPGVLLINTARGALIDEAALIDALKRGHIRHAGLDVFHAEPLKGDHPLARMDNVTLSSHAAFRTLEASETLIRRAIDIVKTAHRLTQLLMLRSARSARLEAWPQDLGSCAAILRDGASRPPQDEDRASFPAPASHDGN